MARDSLFVKNRHVFYISFVFIAIILITGIGFLCFKCVKKGVEY